MERAPGAVCWKCCCCCSASEVKNWKASWSLKAIALLGWAEWALASASAPSPKLLSGSEGSEEAEKSAYRGKSKPLGGLAIVAIEQEPGLGGDETEEISGADWEACVSAPGTRDVKFLWRELTMSSSLPLTKAERSDEEILLMQPAAAV